MKQFFWSVYLIIHLVECSEYVLENCYLHSKNHKLIIDLSQMPNNDWGTTEYVTNATYYFSMCPGKTAKCPNGGFFCLKWNNGSYLDLGSTYVETTKDQDLVKMTLKGANGGGVVNLRCDQNEDVLPVIIDLTLNNDPKPFYNYEILWSSSATCPLKHYLAENTCILYINPYQSYDLRPFRSSHDVITSGKHYLFNFCEVVNSTFCPAFVCIIKNGNAVPVSNSFELSYLEHKGVSINYKTNSGSRLMVVLHCLLKEEENPLTFVSEHDGDLIFSIGTSFACEIPRKMTCLLHFSHNVVYDLSPLNKMMENYALSLKNGKTILLNFCGPLNYMPQVPCAEGNRNFGCLVDKAYHTEAIATSTSNGSIVEPGKISLKYQGDGKKGLFLNITLICDKHFSVYPEVSNIISEYSYDIVWKTYTACPLKYASGKNCIVKNLYNENMVDLNLLYNKESDYLVVNGKDLFRMNFCGKLHYSCAKNPNAAVCFKNSDGIEIAIGETADSEPMFVDGQFIFHLQGEPCNRNVTKSKVNIILACEYAKDNILSNSPELFPSSKEDQCQFYFYWKTPVVCGSYLSSKCIYTNDTLIYDLSPLRNLRENYVVKYKESQIELNVCHSLVPGHRIECYELAGACITNTSVQAIISTAHTHNENSENLGVVNEADEFEVIGNKLRLIYRNGGVCQTSTHHSTYSTTIDFFCNNTAVHTEPKLVSDKDCNYNFTWTTSAACPTYKKKSLCSTIDPDSKKRFDLSSLMKKAVFVDGFDGSSIVIGVCQPVGLEGCLKNSGACVLRNSPYENIGDYNSFLHYANHSLYLVYKTKKCNSKIIFSCTEDKESKPILVKENNCSRIISWPTNLACINSDEMLNCCQGIEDLCENFVRTYEVNVTQMEKVYINLCKPILPKRGLLCPPDSMSCKATNQSSYFYKSEKSLGSISRPPIINDSAVILEYVGGSICQSGINYSTVITFVCDRNASDGHPELINIKNDCTYEFKWATSVICHQKCIVSTQNKNINVLGHYKDGDRRIVSRTGKSTPYVLNLCRISEKCGSHICRLTDKKWQHFATISVNNNTKITDKKTEIFFTYLMNTTKKDKCGAKVDLICDSDSGDGRPVLIEESDCFINVSWKSSSACLIENPAVSHSNVGVWIVFTVACLLLVGIVVIVLKNNLQNNFSSFLSRTFGYRRPCFNTELEEVKSAESEEFLIFKNR